MNTQQIKQRFGIIGNSPALNRALETASRVAPTDLSVLITGESGTGKEIMPQVIHHLSAKKHGPYIAVNCGAIPEGTIDSELFGHEKGSFTGAHETRKGYFEVADDGTIFLDEVAELPLQTQVRLLRVLETGEFIKVGSSKVQKTNVRIVAATNVNVPEAIQKGKFREDLYYRLNTVPILMPALRERKDDVLLLFRKFAGDFAEKYRMPAVKLDEGAQKVLENYRWPGNIRQLKNITEQISIIEQEREISADILTKYLPESFTSNALMVKGGASSDFSERDILYKILFDMKKDMNDLKKLVSDIIRSGGQINLQGENAQLASKLYKEVQEVYPIEVENSIPTPSGANSSISRLPKADQPFIHEHEEVVEESLSIEEKEKELIKKSLERYKGKRKYAAEELGISERTLYRKIKEYNL